MQFKLLQLNTLHGGEIFDPMMQFLQAQQADVMHLQEVFSNEQGFEFPSHPNYSLFESIQKNFRYPYANFYHKSDWEVEPGKILKFGNATFSRFEIQNFHSVEVPGFEHRDHTFYANRQPLDYSDAPYGFIASEIKIGDKTVKSINIHGVWGQDGSDNPRRLLMRDLILKEIEHDEYVICSGDFNTTPETQTMLGLETKLVNVFKNELKTTFNGKRWKMPDPTFVVDFLFVTPNIKVVEHSMPDADVSDHMPLVATLEI